MPRFAFYESPTTLTRHNPVKTLALRPARDELFDWILSNRQSCRYNLTSSGLTEPDLRAMGVDTSYEAYTSEKADLEWAFAEEVAKSYKVEPENVILTAGASEAIFLVYSAFGAGRRAMVPLPNYPPMFTVPRSLGMTVSSSLKGSRTSGTIVGLTDPNNPTGKSLDVGTVESLLDSSREREATVFVNETYREFTFPYKPQTHFGGATNMRNLQHDDEVLRPWQVARRLDLGGQEEGPPVTLREVGRQRPRFRVLLVARCPDTQEAAKVRGTGT